MLAINFSNLSTTASKSLQKESEQYLDRFSDYRDLVLSRKQGFLDLPYDQKEVDKVLDYAKTVKDRYKTIVILGIGGSMLGPQTILSTLYSEGPIKICTIDNIDPFQIKQVDYSLNYEETLFLVQTKSGGTPETLSQYLYFRKRTEEKELSVKDHFVFVTDPQNGYLRKIALEENIPAFDIPENVGGRFSVLTPVGTLVSALVGLDVNAMMKGGQRVINEYFKGVNKNIFHFAVIQFLLAKEGKNINVLMPYSSRLRLFANWYVQLLSESIGKRLNLKGEEVRTGLTPVPSLGATDQHSQLQLFNEGPNDKLIVFIDVTDHQIELKIPTIYKREENLEYLYDKSFNQLLEAEFKGTRQALTEAGKPNITIQIDKVEEESLGALFLFFEIATAFLGELLEINTFDQPGVERSKVLAKENLSN